VIDIYLINKDGTSTSQMVNGPTSVSSTDQTKKEDSASKTNGATPSTNDSNLIGTTPFLKGVKVVYVKDSGNKEVVSPTDSKDPDKRLNATSTISDLEIILNEKDFSNLMNEVVGKGSKLYITYQ
jgi:hypothetical protein